MQVYCNFDGCALNIGLIEFVQYQSSPGWMPIILMFLAKRQFFDHVFKWVFGLPKT